MSVKPTAEELLGPGGTPSVVVVGAGFGGIAAGVKLTRPGIDGVERPVDVIVMATGFQASNYLARLRVVGRNGRTLHEHWAGEPRAYLLGRVSESTRRRRA